MRSVARWGRHLHRFDIQQFKTSFATMAYRLLITLPQSITRRRRATEEPTAKQQTTKKIMKISKAIVSVITTGLLSCGVFSPYAQAVPINGTIAFQGAGTVTPNSPAAGQTTVAFSGPMIVTGGTVDYAGNNGAAATFKNITFSGTGVTAALVGGPIISLWTFTNMGITYSFDLNSLTSGTYTPGNPSSIAISGMGTAHKTGFTDTVGTFALNGTGNGVTFTFIQSTTTASGIGVPEGGSTVALLGLALIGMVGVRRVLAAKAV